MMLTGKVFPSYNFFFINLLSIQNAVNKNTVGWYHGIYLTILLIFGKQGFLPLPYVLYVFCIKIFTL